MSDEELMHSKLDRILAGIANIEKRMAAATVKQAASSSKVEPADDADLDSQHGNPAVRKDPPRWDGPSFVGCTYSECSEKYLDSLAGFLTWKAGKNDEDEKKALAAGDDEAAKKANKYAFYARKDASRAAGWAKRIREGYTPPASNTVEDQGEIPF